MSEGDFRAKIQQIQSGLEPESIKQAKIAELYQQFNNKN
jgi:hypothetical protein